MREEKSFRDKLGWKTLIESPPTEAEILLVEDNSNFREVLSSVIRNMGFSVRTAASAEAADQWMSTMEFDLVLLDIELPRMNGVEFLDWALAKQPDLSVIMLTGLNDPDVALRCLDHGARTYLVKPFDIDFLERAVRDALITRNLLVERNRLAGGR